jgi:hypothetical protein
MASGCMRDYQRLRFAGGIRITVSGNPPCRPKGDVSLSTDGLGDVFSQSARYLAGHLDIHSFRPTTVDQNSKPNCYPIPLCHRPGGLSRRERERSPSSK